MDSCSICQVFCLLMPVWHVLLSLAPPATNYQLQLSRTRVLELERVGAPGQECWIVMFGLLTADPGNINNVQGNVVEKWGQDHTSSNHWSLLKEEPNLCLGYEKWCLLYCISVLNRSPPGKTLNTNKYLKHFPLGRYPATLCIMNKSIHSSFQIVQLH